MNNLNNKLKLFHTINYNSEIVIGKKEGLNGNINARNKKDLSVRNKCKFNRIVKLADYLPVLKPKLEQILETSKNEIQKECAFSILMMIDSGIRVGNEGSAEGYICKVKNHELYEKEIKTYGLITLLKEHLTFSDDQLIIDFTGKKGVAQNIIIKNQFLLKWGLYFFNKNRENWLSISQTDLRKFISKKVGRFNIIKDFRTLKACLEAGLFSKQISDRTPISTKKEFTEEIKEVCVSVSNLLGNTPGICKSAYINPDIFEWLALKRYPKWIEMEKNKIKKQKKNLKKKLKAKLKLENEENCQKEI